MDEYVKQAKDFLKSANAEMIIEFLGTEANSSWNETEPRNKYRFTITTPKDKMEGVFWDSFYNTKISKMSIEEYAKKRFKCEYQYLTNGDKTKARSELKQKQAEAKPTEYNILAAIEKYDVGTMDEFMYEFGYEIKFVTDMTNFLLTYNAVQKEYKDLCRIFTEEQMEELRCASNDSSRT